MNSTLKSLLFWMVLVVVGVLIWNFSTQLKGSPAPMSFTAFLNHVQNGEVLDVVITGQKITGTLTSTTGNGNQQFRTYAPAQYERLGNILTEKNVKIEAEPETTSMWATLLYSWAPILLMIGF